MVVRMTITDNVNMKRKVHRDLAKNAILDGKTLKFATLMTFLAYFFTTPLENNNRTLYISNAFRFKHVSFFNLVEDTGESSSPAWPLSQKNFCKSNYSILMAVTSPGERGKEGFPVTYIIGTSIQLKHLVKE
ncbi:hypothetical protein Fot_37425 [Forsythia ovata]|uniref:Uncharacterized protein n=1 Tax=Forsythia ovata TaxID=205694 RepID=A0ABD1RYY4_9LAMI